MEKIQFRITGKVQGVGFRYSTAKEAKALKLRGWVRNTSVGAVQGEATGTSERLQSFKAFLNKGPPGSRVDQADIMEVEEAMRKDFGERFEIRH